MLGCTEDQQRCRQHALNRQGHQRATKATERAVMLGCAEDQQRCRQHALNRQGHKRATKMTERAAPSSVGSIPTEMQAPEDRVCSTFHRGQHMARVSVRLRLPVDQIFGDGDPELFITQSSSLAYICKLEVSASILNAQRVFGVPSSEYSELRIQ